MKSPIMSKCSVLGEYVNERIIKSSLKLLKDIQGYFWRFKFRIINYGLLQMSDSAFHRASNLGINIVSLNTINISPFCGWR